MNIKSALGQFLAWLRISGFSWFVCAVLFLADEGTIGRLWAKRQAPGFESVGYIVAIGLDLSAALALDRMGHAKLRKHKVLAGVIFALACGVSAFFGVRYYRQFSPADPMMLSIAMGCVCPTLAASIALLRGIVTAHENELELARQQAEVEAARVAEMELRKYRIAQEQATALLLAKETTKQIRAKSRAEQARVDLEREKKRKAQEAARQEQAVASREQEVDNLLASLGKAGETLRLFLASPDLTQSKVAQELSISRQAVGQHLAKLEREGIIKRNGHGVELVEV